MTVVSKITGTETEIRVMGLNAKSPEELFGLNWMHDGQALAWQSRRVAKKPRRRNGAYASYEASTARRGDRNSGGQLAAENLIFGLPVTNVTGQFLLGCPTISSKSPR